MLNSKLEYDWLPWPEFVSSKGRFRLSGSDIDGYDEYKEVGTANFHRWERSDVYEWLKSGKIKPYNERPANDSTPSDIKQEESITGNNIDQLGLQL